MLNLSQLARESSNYPLLNKIQNIIDPDIYLAENIADYKENAPNFEFPWYKRFPLTEDRVYIIFQNIGIKTLEDEERIIIPNWFVLHDDSGQELVYWNSDSKLFPARASFEEIQETQGLKEEDWVYDVFIRYLIKSNFPSIAEVRKYNFSDKKPERDTLAERIKSFFPEFEPSLQPSF